MSLDIDVHAMLKAYGQYAPAHVFANNDISVEELGERQAPIFSAAFESNDSAAKRHAACDECRKRKLKCSGLGERGQCLRCQKQSTTCHFSPQFKMGRPRKKRKTSEEAATTKYPETHVPVEQTISQIVPDLDEKNARAEFESLCTGPVAQSIRRKTPAPPFHHQGLPYEHATSTAAGSEVTPPTESPPTPILPQAEAAYPKYFANWPDFSTMEMLPQIVQDNHPPEASSSSDHTYSVGSVDSIMPSCACLSNLYLTLSSLSTLASFPVSVFTIESLQTAQRAAKSVLFCSTCPMKFHSGIQNVMLSGTLLTVLGDGWHRVQRATAEELRRGFLARNTNPTTEEPLLTAIQSLEWRTFAYRLLRANVFGDEITPCPPCYQAQTEFHSTEAVSSQRRLEKCHHLASINSSVGTPTLQSLVETMERRQEFWHGKIPDTGEFPKRITDACLRVHMRRETLSQMKEAEKDGDGHLCLRIVQSVRTVLQTLQTSEPTL